MSQVAEEEIEVRNAHGLHVRPAGEVVKTAIGFLSRITIARGEDVANARSIVALTTLGAEMGSRLKIRAEGPDADAAVEAMVKLFSSKFGED